jgi:hypothetical protein
MEITYAQAQDAAGAANLDDNQVTNYNGRGMGDRYCLGLAYEDDSELRHFVKELAIVIENYDDESDMIDEHVEFFHDTVRHDSLGRRSIAYWPGIRLTEVPEEVYE